MKTKVVQEFDKFVITLETIEEVQELQGILAHVAGGSKLVRDLYDDCEAITQFPMSEMYSGQLDKNR